ncbi:MAG: MarC family protein [Candidatus Omnitrophica bacterium]|nr:MarC family protein [Candidatus Omnitrophota bacterium]
MDAFWLCFISLFVAVDAIGTVPIYLGLTQSLRAAERRRIIWQSMATAMLVALIFLFVGQEILRVLGITVADFMVAGGLLLFGLSLRDLLVTEKRQRLAATDSVGAVPIGVPLIVGPGVLTTILLLAAHHGRIPTLLATVANILLAGAMFWWSGAIRRLLGAAGMRTLSKIAGIVLASIAVMMVRKGILAFLGS